MGYQLTRKAADDITHIYLEGLALFSSDQAERYHAGLEKMFALLASNPHIARERTEITPPVRIHPYQSHMIIYVETDQGITIIRVRHGREDWQDHPVGGL